MAEMGLHMNLSFRILSGALLTILLAGCAQQKPVTKDKASLIRSGDATLANGDALAATQLYEEALQQSPRDAGLQTKVGDAKVASGRAAAALTNYRQALEANPNDPRALMGAGRAYLVVSDADSAIDVFQRAVLNEPTPKNYAALGTAYDLKGSHKEAQAAYRQGLRLAPQDLNVRNNIGLSLAMAGDTDAGINVLQSVVAEPNATAAHRSNLALVYGLAGKETAARRLLEKDLKTADVSRNLEVYRKMRGLNPKSLREAVLTDAPARLNR
jgi:Flp pilus assembly protein TadD